MTLLHLIIHWWKELYQQIFEFSLLFAAKETCYWRIKMGHIFHEICKNYFGAIFKVLLNYWSAQRISKKFKKVWINSFTINVISEYLSTYKQDSEWFEQYRDYFSPYCTICWGCFPLSTHPLYTKICHFLFGFVMNFGPTVAVGSSQHSLWNVKIYVTIPVDNATLDKGLVIVDFLNFTRFI